MNLFYKLIGIVICIYIVIFISLYYIQRHMLFPIHATMPVPESWKPYGENSEQAFIDGNCGDLHVAIWRTPKPKGTLMMFHGNGESLASLNEDAQAFHKLGYNLMAWDYPGYGKSSNCLFSQSMLLEDAENAYQWLTKKEDPKRIYIIGYSIGTGIALSVASNHQQNPIYLVSAYDSITNVAHDKFSNFIPLEMFLCFPLNTQKWLDRIQQSIFLIHGKNDHLIIPDRALRLVKNAKGKAKIELIENANHDNDRLFEYRNSWLMKLLP